MKSNPSPSAVFRPMPRRHRFATRRNAAIGAVVLLAGGAALALLGRDSVSAPRPETAAPSLTVSLTMPQNTTLSRSVAASGSVSPRDELVIGSDATGVRLMEVLVDVGSRVRKGQLLARGDDAQLQAQHAQQQAQIKQARAELVQAEANLQRAEKVRDSGLYSEEALEQRRTTVDSASAKLELAQAQLRETTVRIAHTRVVAPSDGVVAKRTATVGAVMQSNVELFRLIRDGQLEWQAELPAQSMALVKPGSEAVIKLDDGRTVRASVRLVAPTIDTRSRNGMVYVSLPANAPLVAGTHANGEIIVASASVMSLPEGVVFDRDGQSFVWAVGNDAVARALRIETGTRQNGVVEVTGGLPSGTRVIGTGAGFVKDGERVRIAPTSAQTSDHKAGGRQGASS
jgi:RND family efflux transporter MFP subunit